MAMRPNQFSRVTPGIRRVDPFLLFFIDRRAHNRARFQYEVSLVTKNYLGRGSMKSH
jgi:hypothetical protein